MNIIDMRENTPIMFKQFLLFTLLIAAATTFYHMMFSLFDAFRLIFFFFVCCFSRRLFRCLPPPFLRLLRFDCHACLFYHAAMPLC